MRLGVGEKVPEKKSSCTSECAERAQSKRSGAARQSAEKVCNDQRGSLLFGPFQCGGLQSGFSAQASESTKRGQQISFCWDPQRCSVFSRLFCSHSCKNRQPSSSCHYRLGFPFRPGQSFGAIYLFVSKQTTNGDLPSRRPLSSSRSHPPSASPGSARRPPSLFPSPPQPCSR
jgi:hypothetical protein